MIVGTGDLGDSLLRVWTPTGSGIRPVLAGRGPVVLAGGASRAILRLPAGVPARLRLDGGAGSAALAGQTYTGLAGGTVLTAAGWAMQPTATTSTSQRACRRFQWPTSPSPCGMESAGLVAGLAGIRWPPVGYPGQPGRVVDPAIERHYGTGYERSRLFPGGRPSLEFVRSMELLGRLLPAPPARVLDVGGGPGSYAVPLARRGYRVHLVDLLPLHVEQARQAAASHPAAAFTAAAGDARQLAEPGESQDAVVLFGPLYHLTEATARQQALREARRVLRPGGRLLAMAVCRFASLLDGLYEGWLDDPVFRPIVEQDLASGQHRNPDPVGRPEFFTTAYFHTPTGLASEIEQAGFTGVTVYGVEGPGWPLRQEWADPHRREQILFAARAAETQPSLIGFSDHLIAAAAKP